MAVSAATLHVWQTSPTPGAPFTNWATAAHTIQDAVDAAAAGDDIVVTNGVYATGGRAIHGLMTNRVALNKALTVHSVHGPAVTVIQGYQPPETSHGDGAIRCVYLANGAVLSGFTLTNGATRSTGDAFTQMSGGGVWGGTLNHCIVTGNSASRRGGGAYASALNHCILTGNSASEGGGANGVTLNNCVLTNNSATSGGGACCSTLNNCTVTGNTASGGGGTAYATTVNNSIIYYNNLRRAVWSVDDDGAKPTNANHAGGTLNHCCTTPLPAKGTGNITDEPRFVHLAAGNLRLQPDSPCIDAGANAHVSSPTDLDGRQRVLGPSVDMGAYEF
jgi:hypothetical protein